jgi:hypothetical protein
LKDKIKKKWPTNNQSQPELIFETCDPSHEPETNSTEDKSYKIT